MPRIKQTPVQQKHFKKHGSSTGARKKGFSKSLVMKKVKKAQDLIKSMGSGGGGGGGKDAGDNQQLIHTGKLKLPYKPASAAAVAKAKKGLLKQLKRRWRSGTVAKREIRKLSRTTHLLFPKRPFQRLVREIAQDFRDIRFTGASMQAIQEAAEIFVTETFHKANMARKHAGRHTLHMEDVRFSRFMSQESMWVTPENIWEKETFSSRREMHPSLVPKKSGGGGGGGGAVGGVGANAKDAKKATLQSPPAAATAAQAAAATAASSSSSAPASSGQGGEPAQGKKPVPERTGEKESDQSEVQQGSSSSSKKRKSVSDEGARKGKASKTQAPAQAAASAHEKDGADEGGNETENAADDGEDESSDHE